MHKHKYYRIIKRIDVSGKIEYTLQCCDSWFCKFTGCWEEFTLKHESYEQAMDQLEYVLKCRIKEEHTVFNTKQVLIKK